MVGVSPEQVHQCGTRVDEVSSQWGSEATRLRDGTAEPASGSGRVAAAWQGVHRRLQPAALLYVDQTGPCLVDVVNRVLRAGEADGWGTAILTGHDQVRRGLEQLAAVEAEQRASAARAWEFVEERRAEARRVERGASWG